MSRAMPGALRISLLFPLLSALALLAGLFGCSASPPQKTPTVAVAPTPETPAAALVVKPAPGDHIEDGIQKLVDLMAYDTSREIDHANHPRFYVSEDCENIIRAIAEYTGEDGLSEAWKEPIDCLRYAAAAEIDHLPTKRLLATYSGRGGY